MKYSVELCQLYKVNINVNVCLKHCRWSCFRRVFAESPEGVHVDGVSPVLKRLIQL